MCFIYIYIYTVDIEGLLGFLFRRLYNEFQLRLFYIVEIYKITYKYIYIYIYI